jgi:ribosomal protein S18 acetylase RimI-like enzyme
MTPHAAMTKPRLATSADVRRIVALLRSVGEDMPIQQDFRSAAYLDRMLDDCRKRRYWIVDVRGDLAGVMMLRAPEIFYIAVGRPHRRLGVARSLIVDTQRRRRFLSAMSRADNRAVLALLGNQGFKRESFAAGTEAWVAHSWARPSRPLP